MDPEPLTNLKKAYQKVVVVGAAMIGMVFCYGLIVYFLIESPPARPSVVPDPATSRLIRNISLFLSIVIVLAIKPLSNLLLADKIKTPAEKHGNPIYSYTRKLAGASIVTFALCEALALYGLVIFSMTRHLFDFYFAAIISLAAFAIHWPRYSAWEKWFAERTR